MSYSMWRLVASLHPALTKNLVGARGKRRITGSQPYCGPPFWRSSRAPVLLPLYPTHFLRAGLLACEDRKSGSIRYGQGRFLVHSRPF
jgi:hypothetical protein